MRVALFTDTFLPKVDGIVTVICLLLDHLSKRGIETVIFAPRVGDIDHYNQTRVITAPGVRFPFYPDLRAALPTPTVFREFHQFKPDVVHFIHPSVFGLVSYARIRQMGLPLLVSYHIEYGRIARHFGMGPLNFGFIEGPINFLTRRVMNSADYGLAPSRMIQRRLIDEIGVKGEVGLWRRGVDAERFHPKHHSAAMRERLSDGHPDALLLLYVGRLSHEKQIHQLKAVLEAVPNARLALVGDGPIRQELEDHFAGLPVHFAGYVQGEALAQAYASVDAFVFPSALESFGLVVLESMASGVPVVAAQVGGVGDVVREGVNGFSFPVGDIPKMIEAVRYLAEHPQERQAMGQAARQFAETQSWDSMMDEVIEHYQRIIEKRQHTWSKH